MNKHQKAIDQAYQYTQTLHLYDSSGYEEATHFAHFALHALATQDVDQAVRDIKARFLESVNTLELRRGEWLNEDAPRLVAKAVESAKR